MLLLLLGLTMGGYAMAIEEPGFELLLKEENHELRRYAPVVVAETVVDGDMDAASNKGFRLIADYIFGNNLGAGGTPEKPSEKIAMTAPVTVEPALRSEKISMTAPVTVEPQVEPAGAMMGTNRWRVHFVMPSRYSLATLPKPVNPAVSLRAVPGKTYAVLIYSGFNTEARVQKKSDDLSSWVKAKNMTALGSPQLARYDPPWTLPFWRRNEIMLEVSRP